MRHGFKAHAERIARAAREEAGLGPLDPLDARTYAERKGIYVLEFDELVLPSVIKHQLLVADSESWSGMTIKEDGAKAIIINPSHAAERQVSTIMHEVAHIVLNHVAVRVDVSATGILLVSEFSEDDEAEADWLAGTLLLPRDALRQHRQRGQTIAQIAAIFGVSIQLCEWRIRMTGVDVQMRRTRTAAY